MAGKELERIEWIRSRASADARVPVGIGDDAAVVLAGSSELLVTVDMLLEGVHFDLAGAGAAAVGRKAMNVNLSDIAAMAGRPTAAVVAVGLPSGLSDKDAQELFDGLVEAARAYDVALVGGDTNRSCSGLIVSVTVIGHPTGSGPVLRSGAKAGDVLCVTGSLGYSMLGRHLRFRPRVREAQRLHAACRLHSMIDLSDGLAADLFHLTNESSCGAIVDAEAIPISSDCADDGRSPLDHALNDGEDFELLFSLAPSDAERLLRDQPLREFDVTITRIGEMVEARDVLLRDESGVKPLPRGGYVHRW